MLAAEAGTPATPLSELNSGDAVPPVSDMPVVDAILAAAPGANIVLVSIAPVSVPPSPCRRRRASSACTASSSACCGSPDEPPPPLVRTAPLGS